MNSSVPDYKEIYQTQDQVFNILRNQLDDFYLTGGTALGRFYLNHRYSEDLDFFLNLLPDFGDRVRKIIERIRQSFTLEASTTVWSENFVRIRLAGGSQMKVEFVNDTPFHWGPIIDFHGIRLDNPANILANKITAVVTREEPKDVFDIVTLSQNFSFDWDEVFRMAFEKQIMDATDVAMRLSTFPVEWMAGLAWLKDPVDPAMFRHRIEIISDDLLFARDNSLGLGKIPITEAKPFL